jgi:hypothetical protein
MGAMILAETLLALGPLLTQRAFDDRFSTLKQTINEEVIPKLDRFSTLAQTINEEIMPLLNNLTALTPLILAPTLRLLCARSNSASQRGPNKEAVVEHYSAASCNAADAADAAHPGKFLCSVTGRYVDLNLLLAAHILPCSVEVRVSRCFFQIVA